MVRKHWWQSIAAQLWVLVVWCAVFLAGLIAINTQSEARHERQQAGNTLLQRGRAEAATLLLSLDPKGDDLTTLEGLADQPAVAGVTQACPAALAPIQQALRPYELLTVIDASGTVLCAPPGKNALPHRFAGIPMITDRVRARTSTVDGPFLDPGTGQTSVMLVVPLPGREPRSLLYVTQSQPSLIPDDKDAGVTSVLVDSRSGQVLMHYPAEKGVVGRDVRGEPLWGVVGSASLRTVRGLDGVKSLYRSVDVQGTPYRLLVGQSEAKAYASVRAGLKRNVAVAVVAVLALVLMGLLLHFRITRPVRRVLDAIRAIGRDPDAGPAPTDGPTELAVVAHAFNETSQARRRSDGLSRAILQNSSDHVLVLDRDYRLSFLAPRAQRMLGFRPGMHAQELVEVVHPDDRAAVAAVAADWAAVGGQELHAEARVLLPDGTLRHVEVHGQDLRDDPYVSGLVLTCRDITERKEWEEHLAHQARHDPLTGLANRTLVLEHLQAMLDDPSRQPVAVFFLDLDRFKLINDSHGHAVGDRVLAALARRLQRAVRPHDVVGRFGGDEFVVVGPNVDGELEALAVAERLQAALSEPLRILRRDLFVNGSIGIALGAEGDSAENILRNADTAMYRGKELGRGSIAFFDDEMQADALRRLRTENDLHRAVEREELLLHYQPLVSLTDGRIHAVEALVRWNHPTRGLVPPGDFIPVAEETGLVVPIGEWVLREACAWAVQARNRLGHHVRVSVNLSGRQLGDRNLVDLVDEVLGSTGLPASQLCLEVTETVLVDDAETAADTLSALHDRGVRIAIDDFGTGWSSLTYLQQFPVDEIKLDRSYVSRVETDRGAATIVGSLLAMAHTMGLEVIAEGVETPGQEAFLREHGCDVAQGYLYSKPADGPTAEHLIRMRRLAQVTPRVTMDR